MADSTATLVLLAPGGRPLGSLPPFPVESPWWQDMTGIVDGARSRHGVDVVVLRLLAADQPRPPGGARTYLAECAEPPARGIVPVPDNPQWTDRQPLRMPWAEIGGPARSLAWADAVLSGRGQTVRGHRQVRSWNLSSIWRIDTEGEPAWLKEVPPFAAHEGALLRWLDRSSTTPVLAVHGQRMLLADVPGTDRYEAGSAERLSMLTELLSIQTDAMSRLPELTALGVPLDNPAGFQTEAAARLPEWLDDSGLNADDRTGLADLVAGLPARFAAIEACGVPDTLVHGDFHPGNVRSDGDRQVIIDWGDSRIGHPAVDLLRMRDWPGSTSDPAVLTESWCAHWRWTVPGCDPERTVRLMAPVAALRDALVYGMFLRSIEPSERPYHDGDVPRALRTALLRERATN